MPFNTETRLGCFYKFLNSLCRTKQTTKLEQFQLIKISSGVDATKEDVNGLWEIFKVQNLTGNRYYANEDAVYSHFINWSKTQKKVNILQSSEKRMVI